MSSQRESSVRPPWWAACALLTILFTAFPARAALGGDIASIQADQVHMQGSRRILQSQSSAQAGGGPYTIHEIQAPTGIVVREYISAAGKVFAVAWHGPWMPDMRQLLGSYFEPYSQAVQAQGSARMGRRPVRIELPDLVVHTGGHMRAFSGIAYVPEMLPSGVRAEDIQ